MVFRPFPVARTIQPALGRNEGGLSRPGMSTEFRGPGIVVTFFVLTLCVVSSGCGWMNNLISGHSTRSQELSQRAQDAEDQGEYRQASQLLEKAIEADPSNAELHKKLAHNYLVTGNHHAAVEQLRLAIAARPEDVDAYVRIAKIFQDQGETQQAFQAVKLALQYEATNVDALTIHAELLEERRDITTALATNHQILEIQPENISAKIRLAKLQLESTEPDQAAPLLRSICSCPQATKPQKAKALWSLGVAYGRAGRWNDSSTAIAEAMKLSHRPTANDWYRLANARYRAGMISQSNEALSQALKLNPKHPRAIQMAQHIQGTRSRTSSTIRFASNSEFPSTERRPSSR
jgi:tetratricopeptide (TPR) repeat protein